MVERRALLVGVHAATQRGLLGFLRIRGYEHVAVGSADEALEALADSGFCFTLVDPNGHGSDAAKLIARLKLHGQNSGPMIVIADRHDNALDAAPLEVEAVLSKPLSLDDLEEAIDS